MFADDLVVLINSNNILSLEKLINNFWHIIDDDWCDIADLHLNLDKTNFMLLCRKKLKRKVIIKDFVIDFVDNMKHLGVYIDI